MRAKLLVSLALCSLLWAPTTAQAAQAGSDAFTQALQHGLLYASLVALVHGMAVSLTPCVYPMIAITVSVFGARNAETRWQGIALSGAFVAGLVTLFVPLGVTVGLAGGIFGSWLNSSYVLLGISAILATMAAAMFGAFELALPAGLTNRLANVGGIGYRGAFLLGLVCALIASPCTGPVLTGILTFIAAKQSASLGAWVMAAFALGLGFPFFLVGAFAVQLPKSGPWMVKVKSLLGLVLLVVALYYLSLAFPALERLSSRKLSFVLTAGAAVVLGIGLGAIHLDAAAAGWGGRVRKALGVLLTSLGAAALLLAALKPSGHLTWETGDWSQVESAAKAQGRPMLVDFTASWCGACKELERDTFSDPNVMESASRFTALRVDATNDEDPRVMAAMKRYSVVGLPTVVVLTAEGVEAARFTDFVPAPVLRAALDRVPQR